MIGGWETSEIGSDGSDGEDAEKDERGRGDEDGAAVTPRVAFLLLARVQLRRVAAAPHRIGSGESRLHPVQQPRRVGRVRPAAGQRRRHHRPSTVLHRTLIIRNDS